MTQPFNDITAPKNVTVQLSHDHRRLWVNVDGQCVLRCCQIEHLVLDDMDLKAVLPDDANAATEVTDDHPPGNGDGQLRECPA